MILYKEMIINGTLFIRMSIAKTKKKNIFLLELFETFYNVGILLLYLPLVSNFTAIQHASTTVPGNQLLDYCNAAAVKVVEFIEEAHLWGLPCLKDL